ncbi:TauD/TfdA family dioxygenase [Paracoccus sp. MBLB3053]|uniref:TauD/TfdA family dioxygenase n=1 Tax=Paracoccus aurantius TaxID=3073814 RepID=A0ABU2HUQ7_9RHOB|nr:TauD/TfdA family dioxygenase [Paracoccus sp. MBLB3053]MDS9468777.1 TauD/TfdA family dioxygenase [Paracoccus sp. MBLB3053]
MKYNILRQSDFGAGLDDPDLLDAIRADLTSDGWTLLRGFRPGMAQFAGLVSALCSRVTFDPARNHSSDHTQMVDAGLGPIGLHIENGNTPRCPDIVTFFAERAAFEGSQTTICDGVQVWDSFDDARKARWSQKMTVERVLPELLWKRYLANEHPAISRPEEVTMAHVLQFQQALPGQGFDLHEDGSLTYRLSVDPVRASAFSGGMGFANAVLGPSHNYQPPRYRLADGSDVTPDEIEEIRALAETVTHEINWQDGDIAVLDNTRVMHGRRAIADADRNLFIGMGSL